MDGQTLINAAIGCAAASAVPSSANLSAGELVIRRQALHDVPSQAGSPWDVQWPTQPE